MIFPSSNGTLFMKEEKNVMESVQTETVFFFRPPHVIVKILSIVADREKSQTIYMISIEYLFVVIIFVLLG